MDLIEKGIIILLYHNIISTNANNKLKLPVDFEVSVPAHFSEGESAPAAPTPGSTLMHPVQCVTHCCRNWRHFYIVA